MATRDPTSTGAFGAPPPEVTDLATLCREDFAALDAPLRVIRPDGEVALTVASTHALPAHALRAMPPFSVVLRGPREQPLRQGMFAVDHPSRGRMQLFLVPIAGSATAIDYEVIFN